MRSFGRCHPMWGLRPHVITKLAAVLCVLILLFMQPPVVWRSQVELETQLFERDLSLLGMAATPDQPSASHVGNGNLDASEILMGIEALVQAEIPAVIEGPSLSFPAMFNLGMTAPWEERVSRAASVSVEELAVPRKAYKALQKATQAFRKGRWVEARSETTRSLTIWPQYSDALVISSLLYLQDQRSGDACAAAEQAVAFDRTNGMAYVVLASTFNSVGQYEDA